MGICIPNMSKPKNCRTCKFKSNKEGECWFVHYDIDCPLIEIIRCGECKRYEPYMEQFTYNKPRGDGLCRRHESNTYDDDFCSYGERRADEK